MWAIISKDADRSNMKNSHWFFDLVTWRTLGTLIRLDSMKGLQRERKWTSEAEEVKTGNIDNLLKSYFVKKKNR